MRRLSYLSLLLFVLGCSSGEHADNRQSSDSSSGNRVQFSPQQAAPQDSKFVEPERDAPDGVTLRLKFKKGEEARRELTGTIRVEYDKSALRPGDEAVRTGKLHMTYTTETLEADDVQATLKVSSSPLQINQEDQPGHWQGAESELRIDRRGRVLNDPKGLVAGLHGLGLVTFPERRVAPGSVWKNSVVRPLPSLGVVEVRETYTYRGAVAHGGRRLHRVDVRATGSLEEFAMSASYFYDTGDGSLVSAELTQSAVAEAPAPSGRPSRVKVSLKARVRRL